LIIFVLDTLLQDDVLVFLDVGGRDSDTISGISIQSDDMVGVIMEPDLLDVLERSKLLVVQDLLSFDSGVGKRDTVFAVLDKRDLVDVVMEEGSTWRYNIVLRMSHPVSEVERSGLWWRPLDSGPRSLLRVTVNTSLSRSEYIGSPGGTFLVQGKGTRSSVKD